MCKLCTCTGVDLLNNTHLPPRVYKIEEPNEQNADFTHKSLDASTDEIRLVRIFPRDPASKNPTRISCELFHVSLASKPIFNALSYCWGDAIDSQHNILLNGYHFSVRQNLFDALTELSSWGWTGLPIWIDAICINQNDIEERNQQVGKMKQIYEQAAETTVWLGLHYDDSHAAFQCMKDVLIFSQHEHPIWAICTYLEDKGPPDNDQEVLSTRGLHALSNLLTRPYWGRMWVIQELTLAKNIVFRVPGCAATSAAILEVQQFMLDAYVGTNGFPAGKLQECMDDDPFPMNVITQQGMLSHMTWRNTLKGGNFMFHDCLRYHPLAQSSDPRDKIYALAALATDKLHIKVDYGLSVAKVYTNFARTEIEAYERLDILTSVHLGKAPNPDGLASWVPCWSSPNQKFHMIMRKMRDPSYDFCAAKDTKAKYDFLGNGDVLVVKGLAVGKIELLGQRTMMEDHEDHEKGAAAIYSWWKLHREMCPISDSKDTHLDCVDEFIRTITCSNKGTLSDAISEANRQQINFAALLILYKMYEHFSAPGRLTPFDTSTRDLLVEIEEARAREKKQDENLLEQIAKMGDVKLRKILYNHFVYLWDRRFFIVGDGEMGMAPDFAKEGDEVVVLMGCPHPMVFRKEEEGYSVVGEAYVKGYMWGKAIERFERGELEESDFELH